MAFRIIIQIGSFACVLFCVSCNPESIPIKGTYPKSNVSLGSIAVDSVWNILESVFDENGLTVKKIDKLKGEISTVNKKGYKTFSHETQLGELTNSSAWVVVPTTTWKGKVWSLRGASGTWKFKIENVNGESRLKVDTIQCIYYPNMFTRVESYGISTGQLEKLIQQLHKAN